MSALLEISDLVCEFPTEAGTVRATRGVSLDVQAGEILGLVGESGSGKSVLLRTIMRLLRPPGRVVGGEIRFEGRNMAELGPGELRDLRGGRIALIPQDPVNSLNPSLSVRYQVTRALRLHRGTPPPQGGWEAEAARMLEQVGVSVAGGKLRQHPFNFSQGQVQRIVTAIAVLAGRPQLLLADEPTTSLDATVEAQILWLIRQLQLQTHAAIIFVTHDLGVIAQLADRVAVMYAGSIVEHAPVRPLFARPRHPYSIGLLRSSSGFADGASSRRLYAMPGAPPDLTRVGEGCAFAPRCEFADDRCLAHTPRLRQFGDAVAACHHLERIHGAR